MNSSDIAQIVRHFRKQRKLSQQRLALLAGVGKTVVYDIEKGKTSIRLDTLLKVLMALNIELRFKIPTQVE